MINSTLYMLPRHIAPKMLVRIKKNVQASRILLIYLLLLLAWFSTLPFLSCVNDLIETKKNYLKIWLLRISVFQLGYLKFGQKRIGYPDFRGFGGICGLFYILWISIFRFVLLWKNTDIWKICWYFRIFTIITDISFCCT